MHREKLQHHLQALSLKHSRLDEEIDHMESTGHFVDDDLRDRKRHRLALKDEMETIKLKLQELGG